MVAILVATKWRPWRSDHTKLHSHYSSNSEYYQMINTEGKIDTSEEACEAIAALVSEWADTFINADCDKAASLIRALCVERNELHSRVGALLKDRYASRVIHDDAEREIRSLTKQRDDLTLIIANGSRSTGAKIMTEIDTSNEACERACGILFCNLMTDRMAMQMADLIRALCAERDEACTGNEILKAKLSALCEAVVVNDSYGVEGSSFQTCLACGAGGAPGIVFEHTTDCAVGRSEEVSERWFKERSDELKEYEDEEKRLLARAEAAESELSSLRAKGCGVSEEAIAEAWNSVTDEWITRLAMSKRYYEVVHNWGGGHISEDTMKIIGEADTLDVAEDIAQEADNLARARAVLALLQSAPQDAKLAAPMEGEVAELVFRARHRADDYARERMSHGGRDYIDCDEHLDRQLADVLDSLSRRNEGDGWQPIETAKLGEMVWLWGPIWRHAFPGQRVGDYGECIVDTCEPEARGWKGFATHWRQPPPPPETAKEAQR